MTIKVTCSCGQAYRVKSELAGKRVRCKKCDAAIIVPGGTRPQRLEDTRSVDADPLGFDGEFQNIPDLPGLGRKCPNCMAPLEPHAVFCICCGFHLQTGRQAKTVRDATAGQYHPSITQLRTAFGLIGGMSLLFGLAIVAVALSSEGKLTAVVPGMVLVFLGSAGCTAAMIAASEIRIERTPQGKAEIVQSRGLGPLRLVRRYEADAFEAVWFVQEVGKVSDHTFLLAFLLLLLCFGFLPGLVWWMLLLRGKSASVSYRVELRKTGSAPIVLLRGGEDAKDDANSIARLIENAADLPREQELGLINTGKLGF